MSTVKRTRKVKEVAKEDEEKKEEVVALTEPLEKKGTKTKKAEKPADKPARKIKLVYTEEEPCVMPSPVLHKKTQLPRRNRNIQTATLREFSYEEVMRQIYQRYKRK